MKTPAIAIIAATSTLINPSVRGVWGVGDIVHDPPAYAQDTAKWTWERGEWATKLATLADTLTTVRENLQTLILVKTAIGDPASIPAILDELALDGMLSESGILTTINDLGQIVRESGIIAMQLDYLAQPVDLNGWKNAARGGNFYAYTYNADPLAKYRATTLAFERYNARLQGSAYRAQYMRGQLSRLQGRLNTSTTDAEVQKVKGSIETADAALQNIEIQIQHEGDQVELARTMAENRADEERAAYGASLDELNNEVEANLELPVEDIATVTANFEDTTPQ